MERAARAQVLRRAVLCAAFLTLGAGNAWPSLRTWTGLGDGRSWSNAANWSGAAVPALGDSVILDNRDVTSSYEVFLPSGSGTVDIRHLSISPSPGRTILLELPSANKAVPGLRVGDGAPGTDDIVIGHGATLRNASSANNGTGIEINAYIGGGIRIENGGRYVHATDLSAGAVVPLLSTAPGTEDGTFAYEVSSGQPTSIEASGRTYGNLELVRDTGSGSYLAPGSDTLRVRGTLRVNTSATLESQMTGPLLLGGDLVNNGTLILPAAQAVRFTGITQNVSGVSGVLLAGPATVPAGTALEIATDFQIDDTFTVLGTLRLRDGGSAGGTGTYAYGGGAALEFAFADSAATLPEPAPYWPFAAAPPVVRVTGAGVTLMMARTVAGLIEVEAPLAGADGLTVQGTLTRAGAGQLTGAPAYGAAAELVYEGGFAAGDEWSAGAAAGPGVPVHVTVRAGGGTVTLPPADRTALGTLHVETGTLELGSATLSIGGDLTVDGNLTPGGGTIALNGTADQVVGGAAGTLALDHLAVSKSGGVARLARPLVLLDTGGGPGLVLAGAGDVLDLDGRDLTVAGGVAGTGMLAGDTASALDLSGAGSLGTLRFSPGAALLGALRTPSGSDLAIEGPLRVVTQLNLGAAVVAAPDTLELGVGATVLRTTGYVDGALARNVAPWTTTVPFAIGSDGRYAPVDLALAGVSSAGRVTAATVGADAPGVVASGLDPSRTANRHWQLDPGAASFDSASATLHFDAADLDPGADPLAFVVRRHDGLAWQGTATGARTPTGTGVTGLTGFGTFAVGEVAAYTLSVNVVGSGSVGAVPDQPTYPYGTEVTLTASPDPDFVFDGWSGDASGADSVTVVTMDGDRSVTATFVDSEHTVTLDVLGHGSVARSPDLPAYPHDSQVTLTATPGPGHAFVGWAGDTSGSVNPLVVTVDHSLAITAQFTYAVDVAVAGNGVVARAPDLTGYAPGDTVTLTAVPATGWHFGAWSGDTVAAVNPLAVVVNGDRSLFATFAPDSHALALSATGRGHVDAAPDLAQYPYGTLVTLTAVPDSGHAFVAWSGDTTGGGNPVQIVMDGETSIAAAFTASLDVSVVGSGSVDRAPDLYAHPPGTGVTLTAVPDAGHHFVGWSGDTVTTDNPITVTVDDNVALTATFAIDTHTLQVSTVGGGAVTRDPDQPLYDFGTLVTLTAIPDPGMRFVGWSGDTTGAANPLVLAMSADRSVVATFDTLYHALEVVAVGNGSVTRDPDRPQYPDGSTVTLTAVADAGHHLAAWSGDTTGTANPIVVTMNADRSFTATFAINTYTLDVTVAGSGLVTRNPDLPAYTHGTSVTLTAAPAAGHRFGGWSGDTTASVNPLTLTMTGDRALVANLPLRTPRLWSGGGDGTSWTDPANWDWPVVPDALDQVMLDDSLRTGGYAVTLPAGAVTVDLMRLTIVPGSGETITLELPSGNTADPGLRVGDGFPGTDDIKLGAGAVLRNASGAASGNGVEVNSLATGRVRINNGGRYVHATQRPPTGVAPLLSTATGTEAGTFEYDVPGAGPVDIAASGRTYGGLTLTASAGPLTYRAMGASPLVIRGALNIGPDATLQSTMTAALSLRGDLVNQGGPLVVPSGQPVSFDGVVQRVSGPSPVSLAGWVLVSSDLGIANPAFAVDGYADVEGVLRLEDGGVAGGTGDYAYSTGSALVFDHATPGASAAEPAPYWPAVDAPPQVRVEGAGVALDMPRTVAGQILLRAPLLSAGNLTLAGQLRLEAGALVSGAPVYLPGATLVYAQRAMVGRGGEWSTLSGPGHPENVHVGPGTTLDLGLGGSTPATVGGNVVVDSSGVVTLNGSLLSAPLVDPGVEGSVALAVPEAPAPTGIASPVSFPFQVAGNVDVKGSIVLSTLSGGDLTVGGDLLIRGALWTNSRKVILDGAADQHIGGNPTPILMSYLVVTKSGGSVLLDRNLTLVAPAGGRGLTLTAATDVLDINGRALLIGRGAGGSGGFKGNATSALEVSGSGDLGIARFVPGGRVLGTFRASAGGTVTLGSPLRVEGTLDLTNAVVVTAADTVEVAPGAAVARTSGYVNGNLRKTVAPGSPSVTFETGSGGNYAPVDLAFGSVTTGGTVTVATDPADHPEIATSGLDAAHTVNRTWRVGGGAVGFDAASATFHFASGDVDAGADPASFVVRRHDGVGWNGTMTGARTATSTTADGLPAFGSFAVGEPQHHTVSVSVVGGGTVTRSPDLPDYPLGTLVTLTATPGPGFHFTGWSGDTTTTANPIVIAVTGDRAYTATFAIDTHTVGVAAVGGGGVTRDPDQPSYDYGTVVTLTAVPDVGRHFAGWSGDTTTTANPIVITVTGDRTYTATFAIDTHTVGVTAMGGGTVTRDPDQPAYDYGTVVTITAVPDFGRHFVAWSGDTTGAANPLVVTVTGDRAYTAAFAPDSYTLDTPVTGSGAVLRNPDQPAYDHGTVVTLTAVPDFGHYFVGWGGDTTAAANPLAVGMLANRTITATFAPRPDARWVGVSGGGDGTSWSVAANWEAGLVPVAGDRVILDNTFVATDYTVTLPAGPTGSAARSLSIVPAGGHTITLVLPASSTAAPGLVVDDADALEDDIVLGAGAVLRNASGAAGGNGIQVGAGGRVRIEDGARYVHATTVSALGIAPALSTAPGTAHGTFEYDLPGTQSRPIEISGVTYGNLTLMRSAGSAIYTATGAGPVTVRGDLSVNSGVTVTSTMTGTFAVEGDISNLGTELKFPSGQTLAFQGGGPHVVTGSSNVTLNGPGLVATAEDTLVVAINRFNVNVSMTVVGAFQLDPGGVPSGSGTFVFDDSTGSLVFNTTSQLTVGSVRYWPTTDGPPNVAVVGSGGINMNTNRDVPGVFLVRGPVAKPNRLTLSGLCQVEPGAAFSGGVPIYAGNATLFYNGPFTVGAEWGTGTAVGSGVPANVRVAAGAGSVDLPGSPRTVPGDLSVEGGTLGFGADLNVGGDVSLAGSLAMNGHALGFTGGGDQALQATADPIVLDAIRLQKGGGAVHPGGNLTVAPPGGGTAIAFSGSADVLDITGRQLTVSGAFGGSNPLGALASDAAATVIVNGSAPAGTMRFAPGAASVGTLQVNLAGAAVTLGGRVTVTGTLDLQSGALATGASDTVEVAGGAVVQRGSGWVEGNLAKTVTIGSPALSFEVGSGGGYAPVDLAFAGVTNGGRITLTPMSGDHPSLSGSGLDPDRSVNRWWRATNGGVSFGSADAMFHFEPADVDPGANSDDFVVRRFDGATWYVTLPGAGSATSAEALGITDFSDFAVGSVVTHTLSVPVVGHGSVAADPDQPVYDEGSVVTLTATPDPGHAFVGWSGDTAATDNPLPLPMNANRSVTANFTWALDVSVSGSGVVTRDPDQPVYAPGTVVTLTAVPDVGHHFIGWSGDTTEVATSITVTMDHDRAYTAGFAINQYPLAVGVVGHGAVGRTPDQPLYPHGTVVDLTATPDPGHQFIGWSGDTSGTANPLQLTMDGTKTLTASFTWALQVTASAGGSVAKSPDQAVYAPGDTVTLSALPDVGHHLAGWSGDASGAASPVTVVMDADKSVHADFAIDTHTLDASVAGAGSVTRDPDQPAYDYGTVVTLTAVPDVGHHFTGWSGDTTGTANPIVVTMTADRAYTASFAIDTHTVDVSASGSGSVTRDPDQPAYDYGTVVTLTAVPDVGHHFTGWSGDTSGTANPIVVTVTGDRAYTATFAIDTHTLGVSIAGAGSVTRDPDQPAYDYGTVVTLTAVPGVGYHFTGWSGDTSGTANPLVVTMTGDRAYTATFAINIYTLFTSGLGGGSVVRDPNLSLYEHGTAVTLTAAPNIGHHFTGWSGDTTGTANPISVVMTRNRSYSAFFAIDTHTLDVSTVGNGSVTRDPDQPLYDYGTVVTLTATPAPGHHFVGWSGDTTESANPITVTVTGDRAYTANFAIDTFVLTSSGTGGGSVARDPDQPWYDMGTVVTVTAVPDAGHHFVGWSGDTSGTANPIVVTMTADRSYTASFAPDTHTVAVSAVGNGSVTRAPDQAWYDYGTLVTVTAVPDPAHHFTGWSGDTTGTANPIVITVTEDRSYTAGFAIDAHTVSASAVGGGSVTRDPDQPSYDYGTVVTLTAVPDVGRHFAGWSGDTTGSANPIVITVTGDRSYTATFALDTFTLDTQAGGGGSVTRDPDQPSYDYGTVVTVTAVPDAGHHFTGWSGDTTGTANPIVVTMTNNRTYDGAFALDTHTVDVAALGGGSVMRDPDQPSYDYGTVVTLTAVPDVGRTFVAWSGDTTGGANPITITVTGDRSYTATFALEVFTLDTQGSGGGSVARDPDQASYDYGTVVTLTAVPDAGHHFTGWSGDTTGSANPIVITVTGDRAYTAQFALDVHALDITLAGAGAVTRDPDQPAYDYGTVVTLTAVPGPGQHFSGWSGDTTEVANPIAITMTADRAYTATFAPDTYALSISIEGAGTVQRVPDQVTYAHGDTVTLTAVPAAGRAFAFWSGDISDTTQVVELVMDHAYAVTATFYDPDPPLVAVVEPNGGEQLLITQYAWLRWTATDFVGVDKVDLQLSREGLDGAYEAIATGIANSGAYQWQVTGPQTPDAVLRVVAHDLQGNAGTDNSDATFTIVNPPAAADAVVVTEFALAPPTPNPTAGRVGIVYALPREAPVRLTLVDVQGRTVRALVDGVRPAGRHLLNWDARGGAALRAGIYFLRYDTPGRTFVRRLVVTR